MSQRKRGRARKRQLGQYMTPAPLAREIVAGVSLEGRRRVLEPSCGGGAFISALMDKAASNGASPETGGDLELIGIEIDPDLAAQSRAAAEDAARPDSPRAAICQSDFFRAYLAGSAAAQNASAQPVPIRPASFDLIVGNPPFGGTFDAEIEDILDKRLGKRIGRKIKKETYSFFIVACVDLLKDGGKLIFICSDTILTIPTMTGLRHFLMRHGEVNLRDISGFSDETSYPMLTLEFTKGENPGCVRRNGATINSDAIQATPNLSWGITPDLAALFSGPLMGDRFVATSGMTTGKNALFVREADERGVIAEPYKFEFYDAPVTLEYELRRARLGRLSPRRRRQLELAEAQGATERRLRVYPRGEPLRVQTPDPRYRPYNKADSQPIFSNAAHYIFWEDDGDAVLTYKKTGNWYLRGVGGQPHFGKEGVTWPLVATRFIPRYIPQGYILDSGSPCAFPREGVDRDEIFFALGWLMSDLANRVLKQVINHTRNIQSKDFERMPYPWWVSRGAKLSAIKSVKEMIAIARTGKAWTDKDPRIRRLSAAFEISADSAANADFPHPRHSRPAPDRPHAPKTAQSALPFG